jgi:phage shock protein PspC (stress-responsive transcriptional regulator)
MKKLYLSKTDCKLGGVCGGIGETYGIDSTLIRLAWVFVGLATGGIPALITYIVAWIIIPQKPDSN